MILCEPCMSLGKCSGDSRARTLGAMPSLEALGPEVLPTSPRVSVMNTAVMTTSDKDSPQLSLLSSSMPFW